MKFSDFGKGQIHFFALLDHLTWNDPKMKLCLSSNQKTKQLDMQFICLFVLGFLALCSA